MNRRPVRQSSQSLRSAFTLLELLVTISVIAVLLGILLPALRSARRSAVDQQCRARLASIGGMYEIYAAEHRGRWATFEYPRRSDGQPDPLRIPEWGAGGGWIILPINEMTFWGYLLRDYATDDPEREIHRAAEALSCPVVHGRWLADLDSEQRDNDAVPFDPMRAPQRSYYHSLALFTSASGWSGTAPPEINSIHAPVAHSDIAHPSQKSALIEKASHHDARETRIDEGAGFEMFNILAADGHVERRAADQSAEPAGFTAFYTGLENPPQRTDQHRDAGIRYVSTSLGSNGRDW